MAYAKPSEFKLVIIHIFNILYLSQTWCKVNANLINISRYVILKLPHIFHPHKFKNCIFPYYDRTSHKAFDLFHSISHNNNNNTQSTEFLASDVEDLAFEFRVASSATPRTKDQPTDHTFGEWKAIQLPGILQMAPFPMLFGAHNLTGTVVCALVIWPSFWR